MKEWYEFKKEAIEAIKENPIDAIVSVLFMGGIFGLLYVSLWIVCPC